MAKRRRSPTRAEPEAQHDDVWGTAGAYIFQNLYAVAEGVDVLTVAYALSSSSAGGSQSVSEGGSNVEA